MLSRVLPFVFLMLALLIAMAVGSMAIGSISRTSDVLKSQEFVERTNKVLHEIDGMEDSLQDAREAALHYVLTPEKEDLINFDEAALQTWVRLDRIRLLTEDDKGYPERIEQLSGLIKKEFLQSRDNMRTTHTLLIFHSPEADANRDRVRAAMQKLKDDEKEILRVRSEAARARAHEMQRSFSFLIGGVWVLMAVLILLVILESRKLRSAEQNAPNAQTRMAGPLQQLQPGSMAAAAAGDGKNKAD